MNKVIVILMVGVLFGCDTDANGNADKDEKNKQAACSKLETLPAAETSGRIEVLKSHGFSETQANDFEQLMALYRTVSESVEYQNQRKNMYAKQTASKNQACLNQHGLSCFQLLTELEKGADEQGLAKLSSQPLSECLGQ